MRRSQGVTERADLERELEDFVLDCSKSGLDVHWVSGLGVKPGHWGHREPGPPISWRIGCEVRPKHLPSLKPAMRSKP